MPEQDYITLSVAARLPEVKLNGRARAASTLWRWATRPRHGLKLQTVILGGVRVTSRQWVADYIENITSAVDGEVVSEAPRRRRDRVNAELDAAGL